MSVDYFYARKEQKFVQAQKKTPQSFDYGVYMVARGGIEPGPRMSNPAKAYMASSWISQNLSFDRKPGLWYFQYQLIR